ncbi:MAG: DUF1294 domain-containing protein [Syntrophobacteraceae bacterium]
MTQFEGSVASWNSEKGFGFIRPKAGGKDIFVHIRDLRCKSEGPHVGESVFYDVKQGNEGKSRAFNAYIEGAPDKKIKSSGRLNPFVILFVTIPFLLAIYIIKINYYPLALYSIASLICFLKYRSDKMKAKSGSWRVAESTLHFLEFFGGWPGALLAQRILRHKNRKVSFQITFWAIVLLHFVAWADYLFLDRSLFYKGMMIVNSILKGTSRIINELNGHGL